eukprot:1138644-Pelagomonas_calceolata.AAC.3
MHHAPPALKEYDTARGPADPFPAMPLLPQNTTPPNQTGTRTLFMHGLVDLLLLGETSHEPFVFFREGPKIGRVAGGTPFPCRELCLKATNAIFGGA